MESFNLDIRTILVILISGNLIHLILFLVYIKKLRSSFYEEQFIHFIIGKTFQTFAWLALSLRGIIIDPISIYFANCILIIGFSFELFSLSSTKENKLKWRCTYIILSIIACLIFILFSNTANLRIATSSLINAVLYSCGGIALLTNKNPSRLTKLIGICFSFLVFVLIARAITAIFFTDNFTLMTQNLIQTLTFLTMYALMTISGIGFLLIIKEQDDNELQYSEERFSKAFKSSPYAIVLTRLKDGTILEANLQFSDTTKYTREECIGHSTTELHIWPTPEYRANIMNKIKINGKIRQEQIEFQTKFKEQRKGLFSAEIIEIDNEKVLISSISDVTELKNSEAKVIDMLKEKEILLKEVHHRIKNNMMVISSLLAIESSNLSCDRDREIFTNTIGRVQSMMTLYDKLYRSENKDTISLSDYYESLMHEIIDIIPKSKNIITSHEIENIYLNAKTLQPLGIILNELIMNSVKHAFKKQNSGTIFISAKIIDNNIQIIFKDNGSGIPKDTDLAESTGFGMQLITMLVAQIKGKLTINSKEGSEFIITIPNIKN